MFRKERCHFSVWQSCSYCRLRGVLGTFGPVAKSTAGLKGSKALFLDEADNSFSRGLVINTLGWYYYSSFKM